MFFRKGRGRHQLALGTTLLLLLLSQSLHNETAVHAAPTLSVSPGLADKSNTGNTELVPWERRLALDFGKERKKERKADDDYWNSKEERVYASTSLRFAPPQQAIVEGLARSQSLQKDQHAVRPSSSLSSIRSILRKLSLKKPTSKKAKGATGKKSLEGHDLDKPLLQSLAQEDTNQRYEQLPPDPHFHRDDLAPTLHELLVIERKREGQRRMLSGLASATATPSQVPYKLQILYEVDDSESTRV